MSADRRSASQIGGRPRVQGDPKVGALLAASVDLGPDDDPRALTHGFHAWPARMHPTTARRLVAGLGGGGPVFDPFMGGGTVVLEALRAGRLGVGADVNPVAVEVAWARTRRLSPARREELVSRAEDAVRRARSLRDQEPRAPQDWWESEREWYDPPALVEVWSLAEILHALGDTELRRLLLACLSSIVVKASRQASDSVTRPDTEHKWVPRGRVEQWFVHRVEELARGLGQLASAVPSGTPDPAVAMRDAREMPIHLPDGCRPTCVITSPPYPGVYDYVEHHRRRYRVWGLDPRLAESAEVGARRDQNERGWQSATWRFQNDLQRAMGVWRQLCVPGAPVVLVVGDGQHEGGVIRVLPVIERAATDAGLRLVASVSQRRALHGHKRPRGSVHKEEHVIGLAVPGEWEG